jgi:hypothetical protein
LLNSLLGGGTTAGIVNAVSRFVGIGPGPIQKLLSFLMPMILGSIAARFAGKGITAPGVKSLFAEQRVGIANALPSGLSLNEVPGLAAAGSTARAAVGATQEAGASLMKWVVPGLVGLALLCLLGWLAYKQFSAVPKVTTPDVAQLKTDLTGTFTAVSDSLGGINDAASAEKAVPRLTELSNKLDNWKAEMDKLPEAERAKATELIKPSLAKVDQQYARLVWTIPGASETIKPAFDKVTGKLAALGGLPPPQLGNVSGDFAGTLTSLTESLNGIKDAGSAEKALPKLTALGTKLDDAKTSMAKLSPDDRATMTGLLKEALGKLNVLVDAVLKIPGVGDKVKAPVEGIMEKLNALAA